MTIRFGFLLTAVAAISACGGSTEPQSYTGPQTIELASDTTTTYPDAVSYVPSSTVFDRTHHVIQHAVSWTSADTSIASLDGIHIVGHAIGVVILTATAGNATAKYTVKVVREPVTRVTVTPINIQLNGLDSIQLHAVPGGPFHDSLSGRTVTFATVNAAIATVTPTGFVHLHGSGTARITATSEGVVDTVGILADARVVKTITVLPSSLTVVPGAQTAAWIYHTFDSAGTELPNRIPTWSSSDSTVVTASFAGAVAKAAGTAIVTAQIDGAVTHIPVTVAPISFTSVSGASDHGCGLTAAHAAWCWGNEGDPAPERVFGGLSFASISVGDNSACGLTNDGTAYCWGEASVVSYASIAPRMISGVHLVSISSLGKRTCGLDASGTAWCWGDDYLELLFTPPTGCGNDCDFTPVATGNGKHWSQLSGGEANHICGIDTSGSAECWGSNHSGQLGDSTQTDNSTPVIVHGGLSFTRVSAGESSVCGTTSSGDAYCWGSDTYGELGTGVAAPSCSEGNACILTPLPVAGGHKFAVVDVDYDHACGRTTAGAIYCWGFTNGDGTPTIPVLLSGTLTFVSSSEDGGACGMATDGRAYCVRRDGAPVAILGQQ